MDAAIIVIDGQETLISAARYSSNYGQLKRQVNESIKCYCPLCYQPVTFFEGELQSPHFRHKRNNPRTHWCENYSSAENSNGTHYEAIPCPLFIRQKRGASGTFVVELGLRRVKDAILTRLEQDDAVLKIGKREYQINAGRFGNGMTKLPVTLSTSGFSCSISEISISGSSLKFADIWGKIERPISSLFFSCDKALRSGRRIEPNGEVSLGENLIIVSTIEASTLSTCFKDVEKIGLTEASFGTKPLAVCTAIACERSQKFLQEYSITLTPFNSNPKLIWPPSLLSSGESLPLFRESRCIFQIRTSMDRAHQRNESLFVRSKDLTQPSKAVQLYATNNPHMMTASINPTSDILFLSSRDWIFSNAILLRFSREELKKRLHSDEERPKITYTKENGVLTATAMRAGFLRLLRNGGRSECHRLEPGIPQTIKPLRGDLVRITAKPAFDWRDDWITFNYYFSPQAKQAANRAFPRTNTSLLMRCTRDLTRAKLRETLTKALSPSNDHTFAETRKAVK